MNEWMNVPTCYSNSDRFNFSLNQYIDKFFMLPINASFSIKKQNV